MDNNTVISSIEHTKLLNTYFRGIRFKPNVPMERSFFPNIDSYISNRENNEKNPDQELELDIPKMAESQKFSGLFPEAPVPETQDWEEFYQWFPQAKKDKKLGGVIRFFVEKDDKNFIEGFNSRATEEQKLGENRTIDIPEDFFVKINNISNFRCFVRFDSASGCFVWNFEGFLSWNSWKKDKHTTIYDAYQHYAHSKYSCFFINHTVKDIYEKYKKRLIKKMLKISEEDENIDFFCIHYALESFTNNTYIPYSLEELIKVIEEKKRIVDIVKREQERGRWSVLPFDKADIQNIKDYCGENKSYEYATIPKILTELNMEEEENHFACVIKKSKNNNKTFDKVEELHRLITTYSDVRERFSEKTIDIIEKLYKEANKKSLNKEISSDDNKSVEFIDLFEDKNSINPVDLLIPEENILVMKLNKVLKYKKGKAKKFLEIYLCNEFKERFKDEDIYLEYINKTPVLQLWEDVLPYGNKGEHNTDSELFDNYCIITGKTEEPLLGDIHKVFSDRIKRILKKINKAAEKEGILNE